MSFGNRIALQILLLGREITALQKLGLAGHFIMRLATIVILSMASIIVVQLLIDFVHSDINSYLYSNI